MIHNNKVRKVALGTCLLLMLTSTSILSKEQVQQTKQVAVGDIAPDFDLEDQKGQKHSLSSSRQKNPVVLVFYRGYW